MLLKVVSAGLIAGMASLAPAWAMNGDGQTANVELAQAQMMPGMPGASCHNKVKANLTPEQKAQKKAMKAQKAADRAAQGMPPKPRKPKVC